MYPRYAIGKLTSRAFRKCGGFCCYNFFNPSYGCSKLGQISKKKSCRVKPFGKKTRLQFCVSSFHIESALAQQVCLEADSMAEPKTKNCSRVFFPNGFLFLLTSLKFQTPLTLRSHSSGLKNYSNKNYHIFRKPWASAFRWHTLDTT